MVKIAILGNGVVGSGVYEVIRKNAQSIRRKAGQEIDIKYILDLREFPGHPEPQLFTKNYDDIVHDDEVSIVVEVLGGCHPAYEFTKAALLAGKHVVSSNKELVATHGTELLAIAKQQDCNYMFEASVGGGTPIIRPLCQCLAANEISEIYGILNGTTNYILTRMIKEGVTFEAALADAQRLGYAERDPSADVEGIDAVRKICILASLVSGYFVDAGRVLTEGITHITPEDVEYADRLDYAVKLVGYARITPDKRVYARVSPLMVSDGHPLGKVDDVYNGISVYGDSIGDVTFYGKGAGKLPTASAVVADVIDICKHLDHNKCIVWVDAGRDILIPDAEIENQYFVRLLTGDADAAAKICGGEPFHMVDSREGKQVFITPVLLEGVFLDRLGRVEGEASYIRFLYNDDLL